MFEVEMNDFNLISIDGKEISVKSFPEIRDGLKTIFKSCYGTDIDLNDTTGDGLWINHVALILYHMANNCYTAISAINPSQASGSALDIIASFTNTTRKMATKSTCSVWVKNISGTQQSPEQIVLVDRSSNRWIWNATQLNDVVFDVDEVLNLTFECELYGNIFAGGTGLAPDWTSENNGDIFQCVEFGTFQVYQQDDSVLGSAIESDDSLRARLANSSDPNAKTVIGALYENLMSNSGIKDVFIYNGIEVDEGESYKTMLDGTQVPLHNVYICVRYSEDPGANGEVVVPDNVVGSTIYNILTPGILTTETTDTTHGISGNITIEKYKDINYDIYWKKCKPYTLIGHPILTLNLQTIGERYNYPSPGSGKSEEDKKICQIVADYLNGISLGGQFSVAGATSTLTDQTSVPGKRRDFTVLSGSIYDEDSGDPVQTKFLPNTYFHIDPENIVVEHSSTGYLLNPSYVYVYTQTPPTE